MSSHRPFVELPEHETIVVEDGVQYLVFQVPGSTYVQKDRIPDFNKDIPSTLEEAELSSGPQSVSRSKVYQPSEPTEVRFVVRIFTSEGEYWKRLFFPLYGPTYLSRAERYHQNLALDRREFKRWYEKKVAMHKDTWVARRAWTSEEINLARLYVNTIVSKDGIQDLDWRILGSEKDAKIFNSQRRQLGGTKAGLDRTVRAIHCLFGFDPPIQEAIEKAKLMVSKMTEKVEFFPESELKPKNYIKDWDVKNLCWVDAKEGEDFPWGNELSVRRAPESFGGSTMDFGNTWG